MAGLVHGAFSLYWALGGEWLLETLGERVVGAFADARWVLVAVFAIKVVGSLGPLWLDRRGLLAHGAWRVVAVLGACVLIVWGGLNTLVRILVLAGVGQPDGGFDRAAMTGHAWLWDPLFLVWGLALAWGLVRARRGTDPGQWTHRTAYVPPIAQRRRPAPSSNALRAWCRENRIG